ncbi:hypothetical protein BDV33DRAFT_189964 [Aspergillus novoparasiticus]|uniref:3-beta hydroxysteroid dehydrogenase/isomerase domain-containing protein n=1 Tax=Aspergillus novoparasiticus TaxID=986946 RepID=A0A5N6EX33_9EURO|nr:hypothetical protein BDV33DRAFT_189964 [Aspergillus novoparasiticus]
MEKVLISGGAGFVGAAIPPGPDHALPDGVEFIKVDVTIQEEVRKAIDQGLYLHQFLLCESKVGIPLDICDIIQESMILKESSDTMAACSLRPSVLSGSGDDRQGEPPFIVDGDQNLWDMTYVTNVADAHVLAAENLMSSMTVAGDIFFIQNNEPITFRDFCLAIWAHFGHTPPFEIHIPDKLAYLVVLICGFLTWVFGTTTTLSRGSARDVCSVRYASGEKAKLVLGYRPRVGIDTGLCSTYGDRITNAAGM